MQESSPTNADLRGAAHGESDTHQLPLIPEANAGWLSRTFFGWMVPILLRGYKRPLQEGGLYHLQDRFPVETRSLSSTRCGALRR